MFQAGLPCYLVLMNSGWSVNVNKTRNPFPETFMAPRCFPVSHAWNIVYSVSFCFHDANYAYVTRQGILTKTRAYEQLQKFCEHEQASTHLIFAYGTIRYPSKSDLCGNTSSQPKVYLSISIQNWKLRTKIGSFLIYGQSWKGQDINQRGITIILKLLKWSVRHFQEWVGWSRAKSV